MKKFLVQIVIFSTLVFALVFALDEITFSDDFICFKTEGTEYNKIGWNFHMLNNRPEALNGSTVFIGSSLVQGAINDSIAHQKGFKAYNFAIPHNGYDLNLYFVNRLKELNPKAIIYLQEKNNYKGLHKLTPLVNRPSSLLKWGQSFNFYFINYLFKRAKLSIEYIAFNFKNGSTDATEKYKDYGIIFDNKLFVLDKQFNDEFLQNLRIRDEYLNLYQNNFLFTKEKKENDLLQDLKRLKRKITNILWVKNNLATNYKSQKYFLKNAKQIMRSEPILFAKVYVPVLSDIVNNKEYKRSYFEIKENDSVLTLKDFSFLNNPNYWSDNAHVNEHGAKIFSEKIFENYKESKFLAKK